MSLKREAAGPGSVEPPLPPLGPAFEGRKVRHGTPSGWRRHQADGTEPCQACTLAKSHYDWRWRSGDLQTKKNRLRAKAQALALAELRKRHQTEYDAIYDRAVATLFREAGLEPPDPSRRTRKR